MNSGTPNLQQTLLMEINRVREIILEYEKFPGGQLAALVIQNDIKNAEQAIGEGDVVKMLIALKNLKQCKL